MGEPIAEAFARRLREERIDQGLTQTELANRLNGQWEELTFWPTSITKIEKREREVKLDEAIAIAAVLGVPLTAFIETEASVDKRIADFTRELEEARELEAELHEAHQEAQKEVRSISRRLRALTVSSIG